MSFRRVAFSDLTIDDQRSFRHVAVVAALEDHLRTAGYGFLVAPAGLHGGGWSRVLFLNLTYWNAAAPVDVLIDDHIASDVVSHVAWHDLARRALPAKPSADGLFLGEAIASAFDLYLVGRLLGHSPDSQFLTTQIPAMLDAALDAGATEDEFEAMLASVARDPERAFEDLRTLLFDAASALVRAPGVEAAAAALEALSGRRFIALLHHYELSNWILYARAYAADALEPEPDVRAVDRALREAPVSLDWLESHWLRAAPPG